MCGIIFDTVGNVIGSAIDLFFLACAWILGVCMAAKELGGMAWENSKPWLRGDALLNWMPGAQNTTDMQRIEEFIHQVNSSLLAAQKTQKKMTKELHFWTLSGSFIELELNLNREEEGSYWISDSFEIENGGRKKSDWGLLMDSADPPNLCLLSYNPKEILASAACELLDKKIKMKMEPFIAMQRSGAPSKEVPLPMSLAELERLTEGLTKVNVRVAVIIHGTG